jgi:GntR family transcriptional regulator
MNAGGGEAPEVSTYVPMTTAAGANDGRTLSWTRSWNARCVRWLGVANRWSSSSHTTLPPRSRRGFSAEAMSGCEPPDRHGRAREASTRITGTPSRPAVRCTTASNSDAEGPSSSTLDGPKGYREIADDLRRRITGGEWRPGDELPTQQSLATTYATTPETIKNALGLLNKRDQLVLSERGQRSFVREYRPITRVARHRPGRAALAADASDAGVEFEAVITGTGSVTASDTVAVALGVTPGDDVRFRARQFSISGFVSQVAVSYYPREVVERVPELAIRDEIAGGSHTLLRERGFPLTEFRERIAFRPATREEARVLELHVDGHVTSFTRTVVSDGTPIEFLDSVNAAALYAFEYSYAPDNGPPPSQGPTT